MKERILRVVSALCLLALLAALGMACAEQPGAQPVEQPAEQPEEPFEEQPEEQSEEQPEEQSGELSGEPPEAQPGAQAADVTSKCRFRVSEGDKVDLFDDSILSAWTYKKQDASVVVKLPGGVRAGWLRVEWRYEPAGYELTEFDADMNAIQTRDESDAFPCICTVFPLMPETAYFQLKMTQKSQAICSLRVYSEGALAPSAQLWEPPVEKADLMLVVTHQDDELICLGGAIPYYVTALKRPTAIVYMADCNRYRRREALKALWAMGVVNYPDFINLPERSVASVGKGLEQWGGREYLLSVLVERIRRYKPEVIVTHDLDGEGGNNQNKVTARAMMYAIEAAADPQQYPESVEKYGTWQVKKLYHHLYKNNRIEMDWKTPLEALNGYTPLQVAQMAMRGHDSRERRNLVVDGGRLDNAAFGLYYTVVGLDTGMNDFLEHIDPQASADWTPTPEPTLEPTPEPTLEPTPEPMAQSDPEAGETAEADAPDPAASKAAEAAGEDAQAAFEPEATDAPEAQTMEIFAGTGLETSGAAEEAPEARAEGHSIDRGVIFAILLAVGALVAVGIGAWYAWRASVRNDEAKRRDD